MPLVRFVQFRQLFHLYIKTLAQTSLAPSRVGTGRDVDEPPTSNRHRAWRARRVLQIRETPGETDDVVVPLESKPNVVPDVDAVEGYVRVERESVRALQST